MTEDASLDTFAIHWMILSDGSIVLGLVGVIMDRPRKYAFAALLFSFLLAVNWR